MTVSLNQITAQAAATGGLQLVGTDYTVGIAANTTAETEVLTYDIPAGTVTNGIIVSFAIDCSLITISDIITVRMKAGTDGAESTYATVLFASAADAAELEDGFLGQDDGTVTDSPKWFTFVVDDLTWSAAQTVSITAQPNDADADTRARAHMLTVMGY